MDATFCTFGGVLGSSFVNYIYFWVDMVFLLAKSARRFGVQILHTHILDGLEVKEENCVQ